MAHFAEINDENLVVRVLVISDEMEYRGQDFLANDLGLGGRWIQTSYNTLAGVHALGGTPLRKNFAGIGFVYDENLDAFYLPKPFDSWILNEETCVWEAPVPRPTGNYVWNESIVNWELVETEEE